MGKGQGRWQIAEVRGRQVDVRLPKSDSPRGAVLFLHSFDGETVQGHLAFEEEFESRGLVVICPQGGQSWWLDTICPGFDSDVTPMRWLLDDVIPWAESVYGLSKNSTALLGIGMGGQGVVNLSYRHASRFPVMAAIAPDIDFHQWYGRGTPLDQVFASAEAARQQTATLHLHPLNWPRRQLLVCDPADPICFDGTERLISKLASSGILYECDLQTTHGGHTWEYFDAVAPGVIAFLCGEEYSVS